jgi:hypothetical protein
MCLKINPCFFKLLHPLSQALPYWGNTSPVIYRVRIYVTQPGMDCRLQLSIKVDIFFSDGRDVYPALLNFF